jgi:endonuclease YncB( thermonuclease family)
MSTPVLAIAADPVPGSLPGGDAVPSVHLIMKGRADAIDATTLWFPTYGRSVRLAGVDGCELPQWAFDPAKPKDAATSALAPVPCGAMAKAWLKRSIGSRIVTCDIGSSTFDGVLLGMCRAGNRDLALEMLRVGWAHLSVKTSGRSDYAGAQRYAISARYGIWGTYVLDMNEWRAKAVDRTLDRRPAADINLLKERKAELTPPFANARSAPVRTDR